MTSHAVKFYLALSLALLLLSQPPLSRARTCASICAWIFERDSKDGLLPSNEELNNAQRDYPDVKSYLSKLLGIDAHEIFSRT